MTEVISLKNYCENFRSKIKIKQKKINAITYRTETILQIGTKK